MVLLRQSIWQLILPFVVHGDYVFVLISLAGAKSADAAVLRRDKVTRWGHPRRDHPR